MLKFFHAIQFNSDEKGYAESVLETDLEDIINDSEIPKKIRDRANELKGRIVVGSLAPREQNVRLKQRISRRDESSN